MKAPELRPQPGPQELFLRSGADIAVYGGAAGSGKSFALLLEPLYHTENGKFRSVIFRRTNPQIRLEGGLWDTSEQVYTLLGATANQSSLTWQFRSGARVKMSGLEHENDVYGWQGAQIPLLLFDELTQFTATQFWYLLSRCRSMSGVRGYVRATCNPDPDSWVREFIGWWIDADTGLPIKERSGSLRWFVRMGDELHWADTRDELLKQFGQDSEPKSVTFIPASVHDNKILLAKDLNYLANLKALPLVDRERLLDGNWNVRASAGNYFRREWFSIIDCLPKDAQIIRRVRYWDRAATEKKVGNDPDATVGLLLCKDMRGIFYIEHVLKLFATPHNVEQAMLSCAKADGAQTIVAFMQDPGSAGVAEAQATARALNGFNVRFAPATGDKETRAKPVSAQAEAGNVKIVRGLWNDSFIRVLENFPVGKHDDEVDGLSGAHGILSDHSSGAFSSASQIIAPTPAFDRLEFDTGWVDLKL